VKRENRTPVELLNNFLRRDKEKLMIEGIPKYIAEVIAKAQFLEQKEFFEVVKKDKELSDFLRGKYFVDLGKMM
jgi:hypothetical protein